MVVVVVMVVMVAGMVVAMVAVVVAVVCGKCGVAAEEVVLMRWSVRRKIGRGGNDGFDSSRLVVIMVAVVLVSHEVTLARWSVRPAIGGDDDGTVVAVVTAEKIRYSALVNQSVRPAVGVGGCSGSGVGDVGRQSL